MTHTTASADTDTPSPVDVETIMQEIRRQILEQHQIGGLIPTGGKRLPPEFYEQLYQAALIQNDLPVKLLVTPVRVPVIGRFLEWLRGKLHQLVLFYVNQLAQKQMQINHHLLQAISALADELEQENRSA
jgi:hypothetical protein